MKILVAGATGCVGRHAVPLLLSAGYQVRALARGSGPLADRTAFEIHTADLSQPETLEGACTGVDAVIACAGASLQLGVSSQRAGFHAVDDHGIRNLLAEARRARVGRFIHVSPAGSATRPRTGHAAAGIPFTVIRPTGFFQTFAGFLPMARVGCIPLAGAGRARTNPIHEAEVAQACVEALSRPEESLEIGGPEIFTRHRLAEMAFDAIGKPPRVLSLPPSLLRAAVPFMKPIHPRFSSLIDFGLQASQGDILAPPYGTRRLGDYLRSATDSAVFARSPSCL